VPHNAAAAALFCYRQVGAQPIGRGPSTRLRTWPATEQRYAALVCRLMVSTPVFHRIH